MLKTRTQTIGADRKRCQACLWVGEGEFQTKLLICQNAGVETENADVLVLTDRVARRLVIRKIWSACGRLQRRAPVLFYRCAQVTPV